MIRKISDTLKEQAGKAMDSVSGASGKLNELTNVGMEQARDAMSALTEKVNELKDQGMEKIKAGLEELSSGIPLIEQSGFNISDITIGLGIPPEVVISFKKAHPVSSEDIQALIDANQDKRILTSILQALQMANNIQGKITMGKFIFSGVAVRLGIPPEVSLRYS